MTGFIARNDSSLTIVPNWGAFVAWAKEGGYDESYLDVNDSKCLQLQQDYLAEQQQTGASETAGPRLTLDEVQELAGNGGLAPALDYLGVPAAPEAWSALVKRRVGEGASFDRSSFDQAAYDKRLKDGNG